MPNNEYYPMNKITKSMIDSVSLQLMDKSCCCKNENNKLILFVF